MLSLHVLGSVRGCEDGLTRRGVLIAILRRGVVVGGLVEVSRAYTCWQCVYGWDPHCKLPPRTAEGARWKVGCTEGEEASVGVVGVQRAE